MYFLQRLQVTLALNSAVLMKFVDTLVALVKPASFCNQELPLLQGGFLCLGTHVALTPHFLNRAIGHPEEALVPRVPNSLWEAQVG